MRKQDKETEQPAVRDEGQVEHEVMREELGAPRIVNTGIGQLKVRQVKLEDYLALPSELLSELMTPMTVAHGCLTAFYWLLQFKVAQPVGELKAPTEGLVIGVDILPEEVAEVVKASGLFLAASNSAYYDAFKEAWGVK